MEKKQVEDLFRKHYRRMYAMALSILCDEQEARDVVSDIFTRLLADESYLLPDNSLHYLLTSARNNSLKRLRRRVTINQAQREYMERQLMVADVQTDEQTLERVFDFAQRELTDQEKSVFRLRFIEEMSYGEIASEMGISKVAVWKHLSHLKDKIHKQFKTI
jgi:RNA polymerase sigma-70 factor (ECF subfamily)